MILHMSSDCVFSVISGKYKTNSILSCPVYQQLRYVFLPYTDIESTTTDSYYSLFNGSEQEVLKLAKYIYNAFITRENKLKEISGSAA